MSGIEVAGLVVGVIPLVVEAVKSYRTASERFSTFKRYTQAAIDVRLQYRLEWSNFRNECQHLLSFAVDNKQELIEMLKDPNHGGWADRGLEEQFHKFLDEDYSICEEIMARIRDVLRETATDLLYLGRIIEESSHRDTPTDAIRHLCHAFNVSAKENRYMQKLESLRFWNSRLACLRSQRCGLQKQQRSVSSCVVGKKVPPHFSSIQQASQALHDSLKDAWCCSNTSHTGHQAKLGLEAQADLGAVRLDIALACRRNESQAVQMYAHLSTHCFTFHNIDLKTISFVTRKVIQTLTNVYCSRTSLESSEPPIWLWVQSLTTDEATKHTPLPQPVTQGVPMSLHTNLYDQQLLGQKEQKIKNESFIECVKGKVKKRVRFGGFISEDEEVEAPELRGPKIAQPTHNQAGECHSTFNLRDAKSMCCHFFKKTGSPASECKSSCLGYLEAQNTFRLVFYTAGKKALAYETAMRQGIIESIQLNHAIQTLKVLDKLTLAHKLATAVLQYHSTDWLPQDWHLQDLAFFTNCHEPRQTQSMQEDDELLRSLETLHLSTQFPGKDAALTQPKGKTRWDGISALPGASTTQHPLSVDDAKLLYGIQNMTLAKLGLALLEIGYGQEIQDVVATVSSRVSTSSDSNSSLTDPHDVITARRLLDGRHTALGPRYQAIARRCVNCDFGFGADLQDRALQSAVYEHVVCALQEMKDRCSAALA